ncbi:hypothetical protein Pmani_000574 [Petrolisthes manimaculis]|uniref:histone acetyltransferase n=1 Tax=Petrolisthes manimaculis TaxID=1843537 RepID=A0AAE1UM73_9EUCA|nr:hypothetical protein Pmani_000574 [Petrolisthes manimaculis]
MLDRGITERIVLDYKDIHKQAIEDNIKSAAELPYFEGDYLPNILEEIITELDSEEKQKLEEEGAAVKSTMDPDPIIACDLMDGRDAFLTLARKRHLEFSSLRRAKYSTMVMMCELHNQGQDRFVFTCNHCKAHVETRYHCQECDDFDLCTSCFKTEDHNHKMVKLGLDLEDDTETKYLNLQEAHITSIERCIQVLVHASQCRDANCRLASCEKMKKVQEEAARQTGTGTAISYGKGNPGIVAVSQAPMMPPPIAPQQVRSQMPTNAMQQIGTLGPQVSQMNPMGKPNAVMQQQQAPQQQQQ